MKKLITTTILLLSVLSIYAQNISGKWEGELYQANNKFKFEIEINQSEVQIAGFSKLTTSSGQAVESKLKGFFDGDILYFTDAEQLTQGEYCTKFAKLTLLPQKQNGNLVLEGPWNASDCASVGNIKLEQKEKKNGTVKNIVSEKLSGNWTGDLVQEGIVYDFYYKVAIPAFSSNMGVSYCVIEEHGIGSVNQVFNYTFDEKNNKLTIEEYEIIYEDGEPQSWCLKNMVLD